MKVTYIDPNEIVSQCNLVNNELQGQNQTLQQIDTVILQVSKEDNLQGHAWSAVKELFTNHHALVKLMILANEKLISANKVLASRIGDEVLDRKQIEKSISTLQNSIFQNQTILDTYRTNNNGIEAPKITDLTGGCTQTIDRNLAVIKQLNKKLKTMDSIESHTADLYSEAIRFYELARKGIELLKDSWNGKVYIFVPAYDFIKKNWANNVLKLIEYTRQKDADLANIVGEEPEDIISEIEQLRRQYENGKITEDEVVSKLLESYQVEDYISQPSYSAAFGKKYNPKLKQELVEKVAMALVYVKGGTAYIDQQYKKYEERYSNNYYDRNRLKHNTNYGVLPVDNPEKIVREDYFPQLVVEEMEKISKKAYSQEQLENDLSKAAAGIVAGILVQRSYNSYRETLEKSYLANEMGKEVANAGGKGASKADGIIDGLKVVDGKVNGKIPVDEFKKIRAESIQNIKSDTITLGKYKPTVNPDGTLDWTIPGKDSYTVMAGDTTYFSLGNDWDIIKSKYNITDEDMFDLFNVPALNDAVKAGKRIRFSHDPTAYGDCALKNEWQYLKDTFGYTRLKRIGDFWYAK